MISVVVPAHDEAAVIAETLTALVAGAAPSELDVVVVCNGCTDDTASVAQRVRGDIRVVEVDTASKANALNVGDRLARSFPRVYLDADVRLTVDDLRRLVAPLLDGTLLATSPTRVIDLAHCPWRVGAVYRIHSELGVVQTSLVGSGAYALSEAGRTRFDEFPDVIADDLFVSTLFATSERGKVAGACSRVRPPRTIRHLVQIRTRSYLGTTQLRALGYRLDEWDDDTDRWTDVVRRKPRLLAGVPWYVGVAVAAKVRAWRRHRRGEHRGWERDPTSRT